MTELPRERLRDQLLDIVFGKPSTPEDLEAARPSALPSWLEQPFRVIDLGLVGLMLVTLLWQNGWLPFVNSRLNSWWFTGVVGFGLLLRVIREQLEKHYQRRAKARMTPTP